MSKEDLTTPSKEDQLWLRGSDGKNYLVSREWVKNWLGITNLSTITSEAITKLQDRVGELEKPIRKQRILEVLSKEPSRTRRWMDRQISGFNFHDLMELLGEEKVVEERRGSHRVYTIASTRQVNPNTL